jgi:hypothetical protein
MPTLPAISSPAQRVGASTTGGRVLVSLLPAAGTVVAVVGLSVLALLTPWFTHPALDLARSSDRLGVPPVVARDLSDRSVHELVFGPGTFALAGPDGQPLYDAAERGHLSDARALLWATLLAGAGAGLAVGLAIWRSGGRRRAALWRAVSLGGAASCLGAVGLGMAGLVAFGPLFELFHQVVFPGGNWAFDPASQRLVQLYPVAFWQVAAAALGTLTAAIGLAAWLLGRRMARRARSRGGTAA